MRYTCVLTLAPTRGNQQIRRPSNVFPVIRNGNPNRKPPSRGFGSASTTPRFAWLQGPCKAASWSPAITTAISRWYNDRAFSSRTTAAATTSAGTVRYHSSGRSRGGGNNNNNKKFKLDALPFSISPEEALDKWKTWAEEDQSLSYLLNYSSIRIGAAYCPVWSFDLNVRFPDQSMPPTFQQAFFSATDPIHLPGLSAYAGYSYRRSLVNPVHSTSLVFMGDKTEPFGGWMLRDMTLQSTGAPISIVPDAWNTTEGRALQLVRHELQSLVDASWSQKSNENAAPKVQLQAVRSRRVYMPTFIIDYEIMGLEYRAFVSGCDKGAGVAGVSHRIMGSDSLLLNPEYHKAAANFLTQPLNAIMRRPTLAGPIIGRILTAVWFVFMRMWTKIPIIGVLVGSLAGYRKIYQPWMDNKTASADWERERENEAMEEDYDDEMNRNDFFDTSGAEGYFSRNKTRILNDLGGPEHEQGKYDWFEEWQSWARQQGEQNQSYQRQQQQQQQQQRTSSSQQQRSSSGYKWDFDIDDPYSVLGLPRHATKEQASQAFRKQMLQHHPDTQPNVTEAEKARLVERSKLITEAYRQIKADMKRR